MWTVADQNVLEDRCYTGLFTPFENWHIRHGCFYGACEEAELLSQTFQDYLGNLPWCWWRTVRLKLVPSPLWSVPHDSSPAEGCLRRSPGGHLRGGSVGCCWVLWPSVTSFKAAGSSKSSGHQGPFLSLDAPTHPWCSDLPQGNWVTQSNGKGIVTVFPRGLALILCVCKAP